MVDVSVDDAAIDLYRGIVARAREPSFYAYFEVPDTIDGRFELIALHGFLVLDRLQADGATELARATVEILFADMDRNLREMGVGDLSVGRKVRAMAEAFYGRAVAYRDAIGDETKLAEALRRNLWGTVATVAAPSVASVVAYVASARAHLRSLTLESFRRGRVDFGGPPAP